MFSLVAKPDGPPFARARPARRPLTSRGLTSMSAKNGQTPSEQESREVAEAARETEWTAPSFVRELFLGNFRLDLIHPYPRQSPEDKAKTDAYIARLKPIIERVDSDEIDRTGELPEDVVQELREIGAFGLKIDRK